VPHVYGTGWVVEVVGVLLADPEGVGSLEAILVVEGKLQDIDIFVEADGQAHGAFADKPIGQHGIRTQRPDCKRVAYRDGSSWGKAAVVGSRRGIEAIDAGHRVVQRTGYIVAREDERQDEQPDERMLKSL